MCGILGKVNFSNKVNSIDLYAMSKSMIHRGPDDEGIWINNTFNVGLGHRRLSIIDLSENAKQPMLSKCGRYVITFNGEIYNYKELKRLLPHVEFKSASDTEVLLELYAHFGNKCLEYLNGMFAFAIWDEEKKELFCARDRFGEKPFHYHFDKGEFTFASEIKAFWVCNISKNVNKDALFSYLINGEIEDQDDRCKTFYNSVFKLDASSFLVVNKSGIKVQRYYQIKIEEVNHKISFDEAKEELRRLLLDSISLRLRSDVDIGCSFSGGIDSSIIVSSIDKLRNQKEPFKTFSARFKNFNKDEGKFIEAVHEVTNTKGHNIWLTSDDFSKDFSDVCYYQDEPFGSASVCAQYRVMKLAADNSTIVLLDGQGADEYFAGYPFYLNNYYNELKKNSPKDFYQELKSFNSKNDTYWNKPLSKKILNEYPNCFLKYKVLKDFFRKNEYKELFEKNIYKKYKKNSTLFKLGLRDRLIHSLFKGELQELLRYADRNSMAHSREVRLPYLDHRIIEFVLSLPSEFLIKNAFSKYILRKSFENNLPRYVLWRKEKIGFAPPQNEWLKDFQINMNQFPKYPEFDERVFSEKFNFSVLSLFQ
jgi:asparagine synthase (glutamine-hydrolysing)